jgi:hypothetical protein
MIKKQSKIYFTSRIKNKHNFYFKYVTFSWKNIFRDNNYEEPKLEVNVALKEDVFDKNKILEEDSKKFRYDYVSTSDDYINNSTLEQLIMILKSLVRSKNTNFNTWYLVINKFNEFLCNHEVSKADVIQFLEILNFFQPKILEKKSVKSDLTDVHSKVAFSKKHEEEYFYLSRPRDPLLQFALFLKKNMKPRLILDMLKDSYTEEKSSSKFENRENIDEGLDDLLGIYDVLFRNIEMKILDDIRNGRASYDYSDCIKIIQSFSRASEGTNLLYEVLMRKIAKHADKYSLEEVEIIINYMPHDLFNNPEGRESEIEYLERNVDSEADKQKFVENGRTEEITNFYKIIFDKLTTNLQFINDDKFITILQGILKIKFIDGEIVSSFLNNFDFRINKDEKPKKFFFDFLQLLAYFFKLEENKELLKLLNMEILYSSVFNPCIKKYLNSFEFKEIATLFWIFFHLEILTVDKIKIFEQVISESLKAYINDPKEKIDSMGYETPNRYYDNYGIDPYDLQAINFFISSVPESSKQFDKLNKLIKSSLKLMEMENTHPISRKWFHF